MDETSDGTYVADDVTLADVLEALEAHNNMQQVSMSTIIEHIDALAANGTQQLESSTITLDATQYEQLVNGIRVCSTIGLAGSLVCCVLVGLMFWRIFSAGWFR